MILGVDTGGTFTDFVLFSPANKKDALSEIVNLATHKVLSTPDAPERAILQGIVEMGLATAINKGEVKIIHGSTVATNAALEGKGVSTAFITNSGFKDILTIGRQTRPELYQLESPPLTPPVPSHLCLEASGRIDHLGNELAPLDNKNLAALTATLNEHKPDAVAISLLFSFLENSHEKSIAHYLEAHLDYSPFITCSCDVLPEYKEFERGIATWLNATLGPLVRHYLMQLKESTHPSPLSVMQSSGGTIDADQASLKSVNLLLSGPAGGLAAANFLAGVTGYARLITFDMGGTSTDVALLDGRINLTTEGSIGDYPVAVPMVDMHTIGAGGGSIAMIDAGGLLQVGPQSAGANPGPACYGRNGMHATVTDANLLLGRLQADAFLGGTMQLDIIAARQAMTAIANSLSVTIEEAALGVVSVANEHMARALRVISVARGHDPKAFRLCCFGGAGGLHICALAEAMGMKQALVPVHAGVLSALGMILAPVERHLSQTYQVLLENLDSRQVVEIFSKLKTLGLSQLHEEGFNADNTSIETRADLRYAGQSNTLSILWKSAEDAEEQFHSAHLLRYGHRLLAKVELVNLRLSLQGLNNSVEFATPYQTTGASDLEANATLAEHKTVYRTVYGVSEPVPMVPRDALCSGDLIRGPALIVENNATTWLQANWQAKCDAFANLLLERTN